MLRPYTDALCVLQVGLPVPWLLWWAVKQEVVVVSAESLQLSIMVLVGMLVLVVSIIKVTSMLYRSHQPTIYQLPVSAALACCEPIRLPVVTFQDIY